MKYFVKPAFQVAHQKVIYELIRMHARNALSTLCCPAYSWEERRHVAEVEVDVKLSHVCSDDGSNQHLIEWDFSPCTVTNISVCSCSEKFLNLQKQGGKMCKVTFICKSDT